MFTSDLYSYEDVIHEAGHALGMSGYFTIEEIVAEGKIPGIADEYPYAHHTIANTVMNYEEEFGHCSPTPLDIMATPCIKWTTNG